MIATLLGTFIQSRSELSQEERIAEFYATETAVLVSPHGVRKNILDGRNQVILVDVRSQEEYEREHIVEALSVPAYKDPDTSAYGDVERIVKGFRDIREQNPDKDIVTYCYSIPCMTGRKVRHMLAENGVYVKELNIGWNEWRYEWTSWNYEHEWENTSAEQYVISGPEPGVFVPPEG
ncbi:MAG: rhodanese-like domain-containing protein [Endozoicomonas sp.]